MYPRTLLSPVRRHAGVRETPGNGERRETAPGERLWFAAE